jgi:hypothetical protein
MAIFNQGLRVMKRRGPGKEYPWSGYIFDQVPSDKQLLDYMNLNFEGKHFYFNRLDRTSIPDQADMTGPVMYKAHEDAAKPRAQFLPILLRVLKDGKEPTAEFIRAYAERATTIRTLYAPS